VAAGPNEVRVEVVGIFQHRESGVEEERRTPVLILRDSVDRDLDLPVGSCEALAIHLALGGHVVSRPLTHDLALRLLEKLSGSLERVVIDKAGRDSYQGSIYLRVPHGELCLTAQPGDAVALALRAETPIYVTEETFLGTDRESA